jgi:hypothetical protein
MLADAAIAAPAERAPEREICWDRPTVAATIETEAVSPSPAVFFATHTPLRIHRTPATGIRSDGDGATVNEEAVLKDFLTREPANGVLLMPVIGESGTGKSHLVRWVKERTDSTTKRHVIYLPKSETSLKSLIRRLLAGRTQGPLAELAERVESMTSGLDRAAMQQRLLNGLQEAMVRAEPTSPHMRALVGRGRLETLLLDPYVRDHLLQDSRLIAQLADAQLNDRTGGEGERQLEFTLEDLPLDVANYQEAAGPTRKMLAALNASPELRQHAVALVNQCLGEAVANAANFGSGQLSEALLDVRRELAREGKEIVLLIEDFALIQGVQRELLEAVIEAGVRDGKVVYAPIRTLLAVTTGYYRNKLVDTVLTRARAATPYVYDLDVQFDPGEEQGIEEIVGFVGRYLNAGRLGWTALDTAKVDSGAATPNACDACELHDGCHAAFGKSAAGHGLFPFNRPALIRAIRARSPQDNPEAFNPRAVIGEVVRNVLLNHSAAITEGTFPDARFTEEFPTAAIDLPPLPAVVRSAIDHADPDGAVRRATFLEFWGGAPNALTNLDPALHLAFGIEPLDAATTTGSGPVTTTEEEPGNGKASGKLATTPRSIDRNIGFIEEWSTRDRTLPSSTALSLRTAIHTAVTQRVQWTQPLMAEPTAATVKKAFPIRSTSVSIERAEAENLPGTADAPIKLKRTAENAVFLQGLLALRNGQSPDNKGAVLRRLARYADRHRAQVIAAVQRIEDLTDEQLTTAMRAALLGAALAGRAWPGMPEADLLACVVDDGSRWKRDDIAVRTPEWAALWQKHRSARATLVDGIRRGVGVSRGTGSVRMIDAARALPLLRAAAAEPWAWTPPPKLPDWAKPAVDGFSRWEALVDEQFRALEERARRIRELVPPGTQSSAVVGRVREAFGAGVQTKLFVGNAATTSQLIDQAGGWQWEALTALHQDLAAVREAKTDAGRYRATVRAAVLDRGPDLERITSFLIEMDALLDAMLERARPGRGDTSDVEDAVQAAVRTWSEIKAATE